MRWAEECHMVAFPSSSVQVRSCSVASPWMGRVASTTCPLTLADRTFLARPSLMLPAISRAVVPFSYCFTFPSGKVILIMLIAFLKNWVQRY